MNKRARQLTSSLPGEFKNHHFGLLTSGSSGEPRLIVGRKSRSEALTRILHTAQDAEAASCTVSLLPLGYAYSLVNQWLWALVHQRRFIATPGLTRPDLLRDALHQNEESMICLVGSQVPLFRASLGNTSFPGVLRVNFAGERFPQEQLEYVHSIFPNAMVYNNYGCTEAMPRLTVRRAEDSEDASNVGVPISGVELKTDDCGRLMFRSEYSAVASVGADGVCFFDNEEWIATGDTGEQLLDGSWRVTGRTNEVFKRHGEKVSFAPIIAELRGNWDGRVTGYACEDANGEPGWVMVLAPEPERTQVRELLVFLREKYTRSHWPIRVESMEILPQLPNGKLDLVGIRVDENKKLHWRQRI